VQELSKNVLQQRIENCSKHVVGLLSLAMKFYYLQCKIRTAELVGNRHKSFNKISETIFTPVITSLAVASFICDKAACIANNCARPLPLLDELTVT